MVPVDDDFRREAIEAELDRIPIGHTLREAVALVGLTSPFPNHAPPPRQRVVPNEHQERHQRDVDARRKRDELDLLAAPRATIPPAFAWVATRSEEELGAAFAWYPAFRSMRRDILKARSVMIYGPASGDGKTTAAILVLLYAVAMAVGPEAGADAIARAAKARFVAERDLLPPPESGATSKLPDALGASVLILDDMGKAGTSPYRIGHTRYVLESRFDRGQQVIATTFLTVEEWGRLYDGGNERRYYRHNPERGCLVLDLGQMGAR